jgi:hypothetical protein
MQFQKITLTLASFVAASVLACTGTHEAGTTNTTPDPRIIPSSVPGDRAVSSPSEANVSRSAVANTNAPVTPSVPRSAADTDTTVRPRIVVGNHPTPPVLDSLIKGTLPVRGLYVFRFGANPRRLKHLIGIADSTEINALIIDVKDEFGLNFDSSDPMVKKNAGTQVKAHNLGALVDTIRAHGILPVARIVVFKDSVTARNNPNHTIRKADGTPWHDKKGQTWDIFGLVTTVGGALEVGQKWEPIAQSVDVVLPMVYPSHYPPGSFQLPHPNADPYDVVHIAISRARERDAKLGITGEHVRPWLQAFSIGNPKYGPHELEEQKRGVYDSGYDGWVLWEPGSRYDKFLPALEKTFVSRKKNPPVPRPANRLD